MTDEKLFDWVTQASPFQFFIGVALLVFGSRKILSEDNISESLSGLAWPWRLLKRRREIAAQEEAAEMRELQSEVQRLTREKMQYHRWMIQATRWIQRLDAWSARNGLELPKPDFVHWIDFEVGKEPGSGDDDDDDSEH